MKSLALLLGILISVSFPLSAYCQEQEAVPETELEEELQTFGPGDVEDNVLEKEGVVDEKEQPTKQGTLEGATKEVYIIVEGDNLWDICSQFLGNPFEWPRLWSINQYITNPHYIYPGDKIVFQPGSETTVPKMEIAKETEEKPKEETVASKPKSPKKVAKKEEPEVFKIRLRNLSFITKKQLKEAGEITHSGQEKRLLSAGDKIYLSFKNRDGIKVGDLYDVFEVLGKVKHPTKGNFLGYQIYLKAKVKIVSLNKDTVTGLIIDNTRSVEREDKVIPYKDPMKLVTPKEIDKEVAGYIVGSEVEHSLIGQQEFAFIDLGKDEGIDEGTVLYVVRRGDGLVQAEEKKFPYVAVGKLLVVDANDKTSTVFVMDSNKTLEIGDKVMTKF